MPKHNSKSTENFDANYTPQTIQHFHRDGLCQETYKQLKQNTWIKCYFMLFMSSPVGFSFRFDVVCLFTIFLNQRGPLYGILLSMKLELSSIDTTF